MEFADYGLLIIVLIYFCLFATDKSRQKTKKKGGSYNV